MRGQHNAHDLLLNRWQPPPPLLCCTGHCNNYTSSADWLVPRDGGILHETVTSWDSHFLSSDFMRQPLHETVTSWDSHFVKHLLHATVTSYNIHFMRYLLHETVTSWDSHFVRHLLHATVTLRGSHFMKQSHLRQLCLTSWMGMISSGNALTTLTADIKFDLLEMTDDWIKLGQFLLRNKICYQTNLPFFLTIKNTQQCRVSVVWNSIRMLRY
jgi:hypothetical protein